METDVRHTPESLRARLKLTQRQVADRAGVGEATVRNLEDGESLTLDSLRRLARALEVTLEELVGAIEVDRMRRAGKKAS